MDRGCVLATGNPTKNGIIPVFRNRGDSEGNPVHEPWIGIGAESAARRLRRIVKRFPAYGPIFHGEPIDDGS